MKYILAFTIFIFILFCHDINANGRVINDKEYLYQIRNNEVIVTKIYPIKDLKQIKSIKYNNDFYPQQLYVNDKFLIVLGSIYVKDKPKAKIIFCDKESFNFQKEINIDGYIVSSKKENNELFIISQYYNELFNNVTVFKINLSNTKKYHEYNYIGNVHNVYYGNNSIYIIDSFYPENKNFTTYIVKLDKSTLEEQNTITIDGFIGNNYYINEYKNNLRIISTIFNKDKIINNLYILDDNLEVKTKLNLTNEHIHYVSFVDDKLYVSIDKGKLIIVDLDKGKIKEVIEFPRNIIFIYPYNLESLLILTNKTIYLVDTNNYSIIDSVILFKDNGDIYSEVNYNPQSFLTYKNIIAFPLSFSMQRLENGYLKHYYRQSYRFYVVDNNKFINKADISNFDDKNINDLEIIKAFILEDILYTVSEFSVKAYKLHDLKMVEPSFFISNNEN